MEGLRPQEFKSVPRAFKKGEVVSLKKISLNEGQQSDVESGAVLYGSLTGDVRVGDSVRLSDGSQTSTIQNIYEKDGRTFLETRTSTYEISPNEISDLDIENELGSIHLPSDAKIAEFDQKALDEKFQTPDKKLYEFFIDQEKLKGIILEINEGQLFRGLQAKFFVVCKVGNIHLPFYLSASGESGKRKNEWYPFFGCTSTWYVKGEVNKDTGEMFYDDEISRVQTLLNENLRIPEGEYINQEGKFQSRDTVLVNLNNHVKYQNRMLTEWKGKKEAEYMHRITGYDPKKVVNDGKGSAHKWIDDVVGAIKKYAR